MSEEMTFLLSLALSAIVLEGAYFLLRLPAKRP